MLAFCGFNGFGQFGAELKCSRVTHIKSLDITDIDEIKLVSAAWNYTAYAGGTKLLLKGFLLKQSKASIEISTSSPIKQLAACDKFCLVLLETGKLLKILPSNESNLQEVKFAEDNELKIQKLTQKRSIFGDIRQSSKSEGFQITHIACGMHIACAISNTNGVYNIPSKILQLPRHMRAQQLVCGLEHAMLLTTNGDVYSWGNGLRGQLGLDIMAILECPTLVEALAGIKITHIYAGGWHSAAISAFGDVYTWGFNPKGQLGLRVFKTANDLKNPTVYPLPQLIDLPKCCNTTEEQNAKNEGITNHCVPYKIFTGTQHTILQMKCGTVLGTGYNAHGQLGLNVENDFVDEFCRIPYDAKVSENETSIICGNWCTIFRKSKSDTNCKLKKFFE